MEALIDIKEITHISKISGGRVCLFLSNKTIALDLEGKVMKIKGHSLRIRPLISRNKRVVSPMIENQILIDVLKNRGITLVSAINDIRAGKTKPGRAHIRSFRRQVYIQEGDEALLPESLQIFYEGTPYWIYLSTDSTNCFVCKQTGHTAKVCSRNLDNLSAINDNTTLLTATDKQNLQNDSSSPNAKNDQPKTYKRPPPPSTTSEDTTNQEHSSSEKADITTQSSPLFSSVKDNTFKKPTDSKKQKLTTNPSSDEQAAYTLTIDLALQPVKEIIENFLNACTLDYEKFKSYLVETRPGQLQ